MKEKQDYIRDIAEIRSMMERSSKFLSLSGWAGIMAGIYALAGAWIAYKYLYFHPEQIVGSPAAGDGFSAGLPNIIILALLILIFSLGTAALLSIKKAAKRSESVWNAVSKQLMVNMAVPLLAGGILILLLMTKGLVGLAAPLSLIFYGLALFNAGRFTYNEVKYLGILQIVLGLIGCSFIEYGLLCWAAGFGIVHIAYGIYMYFRYER